MNALAGLRERSMFRPVAVTVLVLAATAIVAAGQNIVLAQAGGQTPDTPEPPETPQETTSPWMPADEPAAEQNAGPAARAQEPAANPVQPSSSRLPPNT